VPAASSEVQAPTQKGGPLPSVACQPCMDGSLTVNIDESKIITRFIAETLLPTRHGKFRVRGYKHSVCLGSAVADMAPAHVHNVPHKGSLPRRLMGA
jgi:hypothetical protein